MQEEKNKETKEVANLIKAQRILDIKNGMAGIESKSKGKMKLSDYIDKFIRYKEGELTLPIKRLFLTERNRLS